MIVSKIDKSEILVSVIVITYNQEHFIGKCLDSIVSQEINGKYEILVGDDASTDNTAEIIEKYVKKFPTIVKPIIREKNIGATKNILDLIGRAQGRYLSFCEGDDYWNTRDKIKKQYYYLESNKEYIACTHNVVIVGKSENILPTQKISWLRENRIETIENYDGIRYPGHLSTLFAKNIGIKQYQHLDILFSQRNLSDKMLFLLILSRGSIGYISEKLSSYRYMRDSLSHNFIAKNLASNTTNCMRDMKIYNSMELWLKKERGIKKSFVKAQSRVLVTSLFHQMKGYDVSFYDTWNICSHKYLALARLPIAFVEQLISKIKVILKIELR